MKKNLNINAFHLLLFIFSVTHSEKMSAAPGVNLNQSKNGTDAAPTNPIQWANGNIGSSNAHYVEGMSVAYNAVMTGLTSGVQVILTIGYDIKNSDKHAIDFLTHYNRILPHNFASHSTPETIDPLAGSGLAAGTPFTTYSIPAPSAAGTPVAGQPTNSVNALSSNEKKMTLYNGTIDSIYYVVQGNLTSSSSETQVAIKFTPSAATAVLAWGGHIGSRNDWGNSGGQPKSAGGISGAPFHMRLIGWSLGSLGNQDRSLAGASVLPPPAPLPVDLIHFAVHAEAKTNLIEWTTATEINNNYFTVERSTGITNFESLATINGAGNSSSTRNYSWTDSNPLNGISYYRLVQTDYDGRQKMYGPICVQSKGKQQTLSEFKVYANLSSDNFYVSYYSRFSGEVRLEILDTEGKMIQYEILKSDEGTNFTEISNGKFSLHQIYFVRLSQGDITSQAQKIVVN